MVRNLVLQPIKALDGTSILSRTPLPKSSWSLLWIAMWRGRFLEFLSSASIGLALLLAHPPGASAQPLVQLDERTLSIAEPAPWILWDVTFDRPVALAPNGGVQAIGRPPDGWYLILSFYSSHPAIWPLCVGLPPNARLWTLLGSASTPAGSSMWIGQGALVSWCDFDG